jgi:Predicted transcriptional regulator, contains C-terminal CBS domains
MFSAGFGIETAMDMIATEAMRRCVQTVGASMSLPELERAFVRHGVWGFPVVNGDRLVGVVSRSDIVRQLDAEHETAKRTSDFYRDANGFHEVSLTTDDQVEDRIGERMEHLTVSDVMHRHLFAVPPDRPLREVAETMMENGIHRVLVTRDGRLLGVISTSDFVRLYAQGQIKPA